ncbi:MAG: BlaI/MecI/CopY family transcriptional regulator [Microbacteriaceae bacterium]
MVIFGDLERAVMDILWDADGGMTATDLRDTLAGLHRTGPGKEHAVTTILTVLSRLERKGFIIRDRTTRPHRYRPTRARVTHIAELMHELLGAAPDREAVLARFVGQVEPGERETLRRMIDGR